MKKIIEDLRLHPDNNAMPFDGQRMIFGLFVIVVDD